MAAILGKIDADNATRKDMKMKSRRIPTEYVLMFLAVSCVMAALFSGCESTTENSEITISPETAYLSASEVSVVTFAASGGDSNYTWAVSTSSLGTLYVAGDTALYQSTTNAGVNTITATDDSGNAGSATVTQE